MIATGNRLPEQISVGLHFTCSESFALTGPTVVFVVVRKAQKSQIVGRRVLAIPIDVSNRSLFLG